MAINAGACPWEIFAGGADHAVMVLNTPLNYDESHAGGLVNIWNSAAARVTVDGGTDRWQKWLAKTSTSTIAKPPHLITGDMDSIQPQTLKYFRTLPDCKVMITMDQSKTDFTKALLELQKYSQERSIEVRRVLVLCDMSGRFDQTISNINTLYKVHRFWNGCKVYILSPSTLIWLLEPGIEHTINIPRILREERKICGLLPIGGKCNVTTTGLKWNLNDDILEFGEMVSSSNTYDGCSDTVTILTDCFLTWTMEIDSYLRQELCISSCTNKL